MLISASYPRVHDLQVGWGGDIGGSTGGWGVQVNTPCTFGICDHTMTTHHD